MTPLLPFVMLSVRVPVPVILAGVLIEVILPLFSMVSVPGLSISIELIVPEFLMVTVPDWFISIELIVPAFSMVTVRPSLIVILEAAAPLLITSLPDLSRSIVAFSGRE